MAERIDIWRDNRDIAMLALGHLLDQSEEGMEDDPMVIVADQTDDMGYALTEALSQALDNEDATGIVVSDPHGMMILILPVELVQQVTEHTNPRCAQALEEEPPEDFMWCAIVSDGGMTLLQVPIEPLMSIGSA